MSTDQHDHRHTGLVERVAPGMAGLILHDGVAGTEFSGLAVVELQQATPGQ